MVLIPLFFWNILRAIPTFFQAHKCVVNALIHRCWAIDVPVFLSAHLDLLFAREHVGGG